MSKVVNVEHVFHNTKQTRAQFELVNPAFCLARKTVFWNKQRAAINQNPQLTPPG